MNEVTGPSAYAGLTNLLELVLPRVVEHYIHNVTELQCTCAQCRRDVLALVLSSLPAMYFGSLWPPDLNDLRIAWRALSIDQVDQQVRRAIALVNGRTHHGRKGRADTLPGLELASPQELADRIADRLLERPLLEQLFGVPVPMCMACNEVGRREASKFCDKCGAALVSGLPATMG